MKKLLISIMLLSSLGLAYADDCGEHSSEQIVKRLHKKSVSDIKITYSSDNQAQFDACKKGITAKDSSITVEANPVSGTGKWAFAKG